MNSSKSLVILLPVKRYYVMAKLEIDSDLCSFLYNTNVPVTANVCRQDNLTKILVGK